MHNHPGKIVFCLMLLTALGLMAVTGSRVDFTAGTTPGNPGAGKFRLWANSGSGQLECLNSSGGSCMPTGGGGTPAGSNNDIQFNNTGSFGGGRCTMDSSSNISCTGSMTTGSGGGVTGSVALSGATSGTVTIQPQAVAGTYNFNLPTSAGSSGQPLLSGGGGATAQSYGALALSNLATQAADTVVMNATGGSAAPTAKAMPTSGTNGCAGASDALSYNTTTHALGCNTISGGSGGLTLVEQHTASASAELDFTTCISATYDTYQIELLNIVPATNAVQLKMQMSTNGGSSYDTGNNYRFANWIVEAGGATGTDVNASATAIVIGPGQQTSTAASGMSGTVQLINPGSTTNYKNVFGPTVGLDTRNTAITSTQNGGQYTSTTAVNAFRFLYTSGNIASGTIRCYGLAK